MARTRIEFQELTPIKVDAGHPEELEMVRRLPKDKEQVLRTDPEASKSVRNGEDRTLSARRMNTHCKTAYTV